MFLQFWYHCIAGFSGALCFDQTYLMLYNMMWTSMPPMTIGILDQDATDSLLLSSPELYKQGRLGIKNHFKILRAQVFAALMTDFRQDINPSFFGGPYYHLINFHFIL